MEFYYEVYFEIWRDRPFLVKAKDVFEAGHKAAKVIFDRNGEDLSVFICEIKRSKIDEVIE